MKVAFECYQCKWQTVVASTALAGVIEAHFEEDPEHSISVRLVNSDETDLPRFVARQQKQIRVLEDLVELLLPSALMRNDVRINQVRVARGTARP